MAMTESLRSDPKYVAKVGACAEAAVENAQLERTAIPIRTSRTAAGLADTGSLIRMPAVADRDSGCVLEYGRPAPSGRKKGACERGVDDGPSRRIWWAGPSHRPGAANKV